MKYVIGFGRFWYDFIVGDDWRIAALVLAALSLVFVLAHHAMNVWWLLPVVVAVALTISLVRETRKR